jgi:hypothetical protein
VAPSDLPLRDCLAITCRQWTTRTSSVSSSIPRWILRQTRRLGPPFLRAFHSPSPSTLIPGMPPTEMIHLSGYDYPVFRRTNSVGARHAGWIWAMCKIE